MKALAKEEESFKFALIRIFRLFLSFVSYPVHYVMTVKVLKSPEYHFHVTLGLSDIQMDTYSIDTCT